MTKKILRQGVKNCFLFNNLKSPKHFIFDIQFFENAQFCVFRQISAKSPIFETILIIKTFFVCNTIFSSSNLFFSFKDPYDNILRDDFLPKKRVISQNSKIGHYRHNHYHSYSHLFIWWIIKMLAFFVDFRNFLMEHYRWPPPLTIHEKVFSKKISCVKRPQLSEPSKTWL